MTESPFTRSSLSYGLVALWPGRAEGPAEIGAKFLQSLDAFEAIDPLLRTWGYFDEHIAPKGVSISSLRPKFTQFVEAHINRDDFGEPDPELGYTIWASNLYRPYRTADNRSTTLLAWAGSIWRNYCVFEIGSPYRPADLSVVTYPLFRSVLLALISIWKPAWASARCSAWGDRPAVASKDPTFPYSQYQLPWLSYLCAERAARVAIPPGMLTERTPDGGLLMIAAQTRLDPANREHMLRSKAIAEVMIAHGGNPGY